MLKQKFYIFYRFLFFLREILPRKSLNFFVLNNYSPEMWLLNPSQIVPLFRCLSLQWYLRFQTLAELTSVDYPGSAARFRLFYSLLTYQYTGRLSIVYSANERTFLPSLNTVFPGVTWQEREVWDLFGVFFTGNRDLRRILTDYGFSGHPLRKDFPLTGFSEIVYDDRKKQIIYRPVSLAQEFRNFNTVNPWVFLAPEAK